MGAQLYPRVSSYTHCSRIWLAQTSMGCIWQAAPDPLQQYEEVRKSPGELLKAWKNGGRGFPLDLGRELAE